jgi:hypothetical protein
MKDWGQALKDSMITGAAAALASSAAVAWRGRQDSGSPLAPINATSHVFWGDEAGEVEQATWRHTLPGLLINAGAGVWWALVLQKLYGEEIDKRGLPAAVLGATATAALAYAVDYHLVPKRLTPGWELRITRRSLFLGLGAMAVGLAAGALLSRGR